MSNVFRFDIASQKYDVLSQRFDRLFPPDARPDGQLMVYEYTGQGLSPSLIRPEKRDDLGTIEFLGTKVINTHSLSSGWVLITFVPRNSTVPRSSRFSGRISDGLRPWPVYS